MIQNWAIDSSLIVRMVTNRPKNHAEAVIDKLTSLQNMGCRVWASSIAIGESYIAIQHHYHIPKKQVRLALLDLFEAGWAIPMDGEAVLDALRASSGPGLIDRLISIQGAKQGMKTLTLDRKMGKLSDCEMIKL